MAFQSIRDKMNQNQKPFIIGGIVLACVAVGLPRTMTLPRQAKLRL